MLGRLQVRWYDPENDASEGLVASCGVYSRGNEGEDRLDDKWRFAVERFDTHSTGDIANEFHWSRSAICSAIVDRSTH